jgi:hypothetical protein
MTTGMPSLSQAFNLFTAVPGESGEGEPIVTDPIQMPFKKRKPTGGASALLVREK